MKKALSFLAPAALLALSACATPFKADVSRFSEFAVPQGQSFVVKAVDPSDNGGIEFGQYAALVSQEMQGLGYVPATSGGADMTVTLDYGVDTGKERTVVRDDPFYDPYWGYGGYYRPYVVRGPGGRRYVRGFYDPFLFGGFNRPYEVSNYTVYTSGIGLTIERNADGKRLFEGKAEAKSRSNKLQYLVPNLVEAMFTDFPGNSGETVRISVAPEDKK